MERNRTGRRIQDGSAAGWSEAAAGAGASEADRRAREALARSLFGGGGSPHCPAAVGAPTGRQPSSESIYFSAAARAYMPPGILVSAALEIVHLYGNPGEFLNIGDGKPVFDLGHLIRREFSSDLRVLARRVLADPNPAYGRPRRFESEGEARYIRLAVHPGGAALGDPLLLVCFETLAPAAVVAPIARLEADWVVFGGTRRELEDELAATRARLRAAATELDHANEALEALTEQAQAAIDELREAREALQSSQDQLRESRSALGLVEEDLRVTGTELLALGGQLESIHNGVRDPLLVLSRRLQIERYNPAAAELFGLPLCGKVIPLAALRLPAGLPDFSEQVEEVLLRGASCEAQISSNTRHYTLHVVPADLGGKDHGAIVFLRDITVLTGVENALRASQLQLLTVLDRTLAAASLKDPAGRYIYVNQRFSELFGVSSVEVLGQTDQQIFPPATAELFRRCDLEAMRADVALEVEESVSTLDGTVDLHTLRVPLFDDDGSVYAVCTQTLDVTARRATEARLRLMGHIADRTGEGLVVTDTAGVIVFVNPIFERISGFGLDQLVGKPEALLHGQGDGAASRCSVWTQIRAHGCWEGEVSLCRREGTAYLTRLTVVPLRDDHGRLLNYLVSVPDPGRAAALPQA
jgi:two-component system CheB/CheR fusion protein